MGRSKTRKPKEAKPASVPVAAQQMEIAALHSFIDKAERGEPLTAEEAQALRATVSTTAYLTAEIKRKRVSLQRLRNWLFGAPTEKTDRVCPPPEAEADANAPETGPEPRVPGPKPKRKGHGRNPASCYRGAERVKVAHPDLSAGDPCPECPKGKVYPMAEPAVLIRVVGLAPLSAKRVELDRYRCNCCDEIFKAPPPEGTSVDKYDETASSMVGSLRYGLGTPFFRLEKFQAGLGIPKAPTNCSSPGYGIGSPCGDPPVSPSGWAAA